MRRQAVLVFLLLLAFAVPGPASAVGLRLVAEGFDQLTLVTAPRSGDPNGTLYVVEQEGQIWKRRDGDNRLFLDIRNVVSCCGERGLLGLAFDPGYATNHFVYVSFTNNGGDTRVVRYRANDAHTRVREGTRRTLIRVSQPAGNHNGGRLAFGPDGRLYLGLGDGGGSCDPAGRAQNLRSRLGKLLSIDPRALGSGWRMDGYGLRNPWGVSFDRQTGRLYIADVGQSRWEEVNTRRRSALGGKRENYLWDVYEGRERGTCANGGLRGNGTRVFPVSAYSHSVGCSITGGHAYRGSNLASKGWYYFGDYCSGRIWRLLMKDGKLHRERRLALDTPHNITSFGENRRGELFLTTVDGEVFRLVRS